MGVVIGGLMLAMHMAVMDWSGMPVPRGEALTNRGLDHREPRGCRRSVAHQCCQRLNPAVVVRRFVANACSCSFLATNESNEQTLKVL
jgi:hypothetical protein